MTHTLYFSKALIESAWHDNVGVHIDETGKIEQIETGLTSIPVSVSRAALSGAVNLHSHAHQRAMAGLAERSSSNMDSFWTWRSTMYAMLHSMKPEHLASVAAQLYVEMLKAGYTRVAEFQYLHHQSSGTPYEQPSGNEFASGEGCTKRGDRSNYAASYL